VYFYQFIHFFCQKKKLEAYRYISPAAGRAEK
jgi:hypothetical protein